MKKYGIFENIFFSHKYVLQNSLWKYSICASIITLLSISSAFLMTMLPAYTIDLLSLSTGYQTLFYRLSIYFILLYTITILYARLKNSTENDVSFKRMFNGLDYYEHVLKTKFENIDTEEGKKIITSGIDSYFDGYHEGFHHIILDFRAVLEAILGLLTYCFFFAYQINVLVPIILLLLSSLSILANRQKSEWVYKNKEIWGKLDAKLRYMYTQTTSVENAKDIRLYNMSDWLQKTYTSLVDNRLHWLKSEVKRDTWVSIFERVLTAIKYAVVFATLFYIYQVKAEESASTFVFTLGLMMGINSWTEKIFENIKYLQSNNVHVNSSRRVLDLNADSKATIDGKEITLEKELRFENVTFGFQDTDQKIFENLCLTIKKGEKLGIVGMNGAGKTTLVKLMCGLYTPTSGRIRLDDVNISQYAMEDYLHIFSALFQDFHVFALSVKENVACCAADGIDDDKVNAALSEAGILEKIQLLKQGTDTIMLKELDEEGAVLSGGEIQKLLLARCLYKDAQILLLDEPTAALDALAENELYEKYAMLDRDKTSIFVSHRLSSTKFCDRIIVLEKGKIIQEGTHDELINVDGKYAQLYNIQASYYSGGDESDR